MEGIAEDNVLLLLVSEVVELIIVRESEPLLVEDKLAETVGVADDAVVPLAMSVLRELPLVTEAESLAIEAEIVVGLETIELELADTVGVFVLLETEPSKVDPTPFDMIALLLMAELVTEVESDVAI